MRNVVLGTKTIGDGFPTFIIAEIGINHNGKVSLAKEMVLAAWEAGADAVKLQTFVTREFLHPSHPGFDYDVSAEIAHEKEQEIWDFARSHGVQVFSTPEEFSSLAFVRRQSPPAIKIAAMDFNYQELVQAAASMGIPIILSSGMSTLEETLQAVRWVEEAGNERYIVLHCVSCYPTQARSCNLRVIQTLKQVLGCPIGFSDHSVGLHVPLAAIALGANVIEKHFTLDKKFPGPDHHCSMDQEDLRSLVLAARDIEVSLGNGKKGISPEERFPRQFKRRGVYAARDLLPGSPLRREDVVFLAPSSERSCVSCWPAMAGKRLGRAIAGLATITLDDLE